MKPENRLTLKNKLRILGKIYQNNSHKRRILRRLSQVITTVEYIKIRLTTRCNCNCEMCYWRTKDEELDLNVVKKVIDDAALLGIKTINFTGGEPTIYPGFIECVERVKTKGSRVTVSTSGVLSEAILRYLGEKVNAVDISLDSHEPAMHDKTRNRKGTFANVIHSLEVLNRYNMPVQINITVRPDNFKFIYRVIPLVAGLVKTVNFHLVDTSDNDLKDLEFTREQIKEFYLREVPLIIKEGIKHRLKYRIQPLIEKDKPLKNMKALEVILDSGSYPRQLRSLLKLDTAPCMIPRKVLRINANGEISPCCTLDSKEGILGNIVRESLLAVVSCDKYSDFISKARPARGLCAECGREYRRYWYSGK